MKRSKFSLSHYKLATMDMGKLYPIAVFDALPGDTIQQATTALVRMQPMLAPVMHPIEVKIHHWFVPYRLIWDGFEDFITGNDTPEFPVISKDFTKGSLGDYFGLFGSQEVSALPFRAYQLIWNNFYRDQDLQTELVDTQEDGSDTQTNTDLLPVSWSKDYFTTARPWTQKGSDITIPVGGDFSGSITGLPTFSGGGSMDFTGNYPLRFTGTGNSQNAGMRVTTPEDTPPGESGFVVMAQNGNSLQATTQNVTGTLNLDRGGINIDELRLALALQRYEEARAKYGSRYVEYLRYLGVRSSDARLQLPEYLGGGKQIIQISEVLNTSNDNTGAMAGHGLTAMRSNRYRRFFEEHGVVISLMYIMPKAMYIQGTHRSWLKRTKEDYFQRELQHIGMQEVYTRELFGTAPSDTVFGYQDRYDEYRRHPSSIAGDFRDTLDFWHLGRNFSQAPVLNASFITGEPTKRVFAEQTQNEILVMANHSIQARRMLTKVAKTATF